MRDIIDIVETGSMFPGFEQPMQNDDLNDLVRYAATQRVRLDITEYPSGIKLWMIRSYNQNLGNGTRIMTDLCEYADLLDKPTYLSRDEGLGGSTDEQLFRFYTRLGFLPQTGSPQKMIRNPKNSVDTKSDIMHK